MPEILNSVFTPIASFYLFHTFSKIKPKKDFILALISFAVLHTSVNWFIDIMPIRFVLTFICVFILSLGFTMKTPHRILLTSVFIAITAIADVLATLFSVVFLDVSINQTYNEPFFSLGVLQTFTIVFTTLFLIHHTKHQQFSNSYSKKTAILYLLPAATILANWTGYVIVRNFDLSKGLELLLIANSFVLILINFIVFYISDNIYNQLQYEYKLRIAEEMILEQSKKYLSLVENNVEIRGIKHDHRNFIVGAITNLEQENYDELKTHLEEQLDTLEKVSYISPTAPIFETIIEYKQKEAQKYGIKIICDTNVQGIFEFDSVDFAIIFGNLIDNAIEATSKIEDIKSRDIDVFIELRNNYILLSVTNPVKKDINIHELKTTKPDQKNHGFGLLSVQKIVDKYNGSLLLKCQDNKFEASIILSQLEISNCGAQNAKRV